MNHVSLLAEIESITAQLQVFGGLTVDETDRIHTACIITGIEKAKVAPQPDSVCILNEFETTLMAIKMLGRDGVADFLDRGGTLMNRETLYLLSRTRFPKSLTDAFGEIFRGLEELAVVIRENSPEAARQRSHEDVQRKRQESRRQRSRKPSGYFRT